MSLLNRLGKNLANNEANKPQAAATAATADKMRAARAAPTTPRETLITLKKQVQDKLLLELDINADLGNTPQVRRTIEEAFNSILGQENIAVSRQEREQLFEQVVAEILGYGPIETLLADEDITEIMVNGPNSVYIEQRGKLTKTPIVFESNE
ncbi:MAG: CpaF family protein, partial [Chloroflexi bacterium]|nr:CpaF family protein [Chloroflexota bacterium]